MTKAFSIGSIPAFTPGSGLGQGDGQVDAQIIFFDVFYVSDDFEFTVTENEDDH